MIVRDTLLFCQEFDPVPKNYRSEKNRKKKNFVPLGTCLEVYNFSARSYPLPIGADLNTMSLIYTMTPPLQTGVTTGGIFMKLSRLTRKVQLETLEDRCVLSASFGNNVLITTNTGDIKLVSLHNGQTLQDVKNANPSARSVEYDQRVSVSLIPNDPSFGSLYGLRNTGQSGGTVDADIDADQAWDVTTGSLKTVVGIIDTGIDYTHPDLYKNIWLNQREIPTNLGLVDTDGDGLITFWDLNEPANAGKVNDFNNNGRIDGKDVLNDTRWANGADNDGNGKIDDLIGWNFVTNTNDPFDDNSHGTHVSGTIGAMGNNGVGVVGVNWKVQMAGLKFLDANGSGSTSGAIAALNYAVSVGIKITNNSWGGGGYSSALDTAITNARNAGSIFVAAAGNSSQNNDTTANYPSNYTQDNVIAVASSTNTDSLSSFSNYGATTVDLAAPGSNILSTTPNNTYSTYSGTSMATPHVAGAVALIWGQNPNLTYNEVVARILNNVDPVSGLTGKVKTGGRLNVFKALGTPAADTSGPRVVSSTANSPTSPSSVRLTFSEAIDPTTLTLADITGFTAPNGSTITPTAVTAVSGSGNTQFDVTFPTQTASGSYRFDVGPNITDVAGNLMDQNQNGVLGEATDTFRATFAASSSSTQTFTNSTRFAINDLSTSSSSITIGQDISITDVNIRVNILHTYDSDLWIWVVGPDGTSRDLAIYRGGSGDNFSTTTFDDQATTAISRGRAPFNGSYRPETLLSGFNGKSAMGTWTLYVYDSQLMDVGTIVSWSVVVTGGSSGTLSKLGTTNATSSGPVTSVSPAYVAANDTASRLTRSDVASTAVANRAAVLDSIFSMSGPSVRRTLTRWMGSGQN
ncbi:MAG: hypothetical protein EBV06_00330 [Planctomycetia bacterium]|nr:hypothetical protein [Planctomycetia bacterium]